MKSLSGPTMALATLALIVLLWSAAAAQEATMTVWALPYRDAAPWGIALDDGMVYVAAHGGREIYRLDPGASTYRSWGVGLAPTDVAVVEGIPFCSVEENNAIVYFHPDGLAVSTGLIPFPGADPQEIHRGADTPDGRAVLWLVEQSAPAIVRFEYDAATQTPGVFGDPSEIGSTPTSVLVEPHVETAGYERFPYDLSLMPEPYRVAPARSSGAFEEWRFFIPGLQVRDLAVTAGGALWLSVGAPILLRFDPGASTVQEVETVPNAMIDRGLVADADGSVWFGTTVEGAIGHFDPETGRSEVWRIPGTQEIFDLAFAPDGSLWYTDRGADLLGRLDPMTHQVALYDLPAGSEPLHLAIGPEGTVWFTTGTGNAIGGLTLSKE